MDGLDAARKELLHVSDLVHALPVEYLARREELRKEIALVAHELRKHEAKRLAEGNNRA